MVIQGQKPQFLRFIYISQQKLQNNFVVKLAYFFFNNRQAFDRDLTCFSDDAAWLETAIFVFNLRIQTILQSGHLYLWGIFPASTVRTETIKKKFLRGWFYHLGRCGKLGRKIFSKQHTKQQTSSSFTDNASVNARLYLQRIAQQVPPIIHTSVTVSLGTKSHETSIFTYY